MNYIAVRGQGNPNDEGGPYQQAIGVLYAIAYTIKERPHYEIYLSDARRVEPSKWKTVIRHPVKEQ